METTFALFNSKKFFIGYSNIVPPTVEYFKELKNFNPQKFFWDGDYDTGCLKSISEMKINEFSLEEEFVRKLETIYNPKFTQIIFIKQLKELCKKLDCFTDDFRLLCEDFSPIICDYENFIENLKKDNKLNTKRDLYEINKDLLKQTENF